MFPAAQKLSLSVPDECRGHYRPILKHCTKLWKYCKCEELRQQEWPSTAAVIREVLSAPTLLSVAAGAEGEPLQVE